MNDVGKITLESRIPFRALDPGGISFPYLWYETTYLMTGLPFALGFSLRTEGRNLVPAEGPVLVIANHQSFLDPVLVGLASRRHLCFLARKTLFRNPFFSWLIRSLNAVPIDQEGIGKEGMKATLKLLDRGQAVVVFPEGERTMDGKIHPLKAGIHLLIKKTGAAVVPVGIAGAYHAWPRWRKFPLPAPLFLPAGQGTLAVSVGPPVAAARIAALPREQALGELFDLIYHRWERAEKLRRK